MIVIFLSEMDLVKVVFSVGQVVYAKLKGYPPWPAVITFIPKGRKVAKVLYFNSGQCSELSFAKLTPVHAAKNIELKYLNKNIGFTKAFNEMVLVMGQAEKKKEKELRVNLRKLTPSEIKHIQNGLKRKQPTKIEEKRRLRNGRLY